jgi:exodeoxyribonuclease VII small subunit
MTAKSQLEPISFESAVAELETIVIQMESDNLNLEQSLGAYKRGSELINSCQEMLHDVEQQVRILNDANKLTPFKQTNE